MINERWIGYNVDREMPRKKNCQNKMSTSPDLNLGPLEKQKCYPYGRHITHRVGCLISYIIRWREYIRAILTATEEIKSRHTTMHSYKVYFRFFSPTMHEPPSGPGPPHYGGFTNTLKLDTPFFWTSDQPDAETSTWQHQTLTRDKHSRPRRDSNPQS